MGVAQKLEQLVAFKSITNNLVGTEECVRHVRKSLLDSGMEVQVIRSNDFPSIVATSQKDAKKPKVLLQAHLDVVPAKDEMFELKEVDGKLYGRGVFDMKFAAACFLQLAEELKDEMAQYDFGIMLTSDEEIGGKNGVKHLLEQGYGADVCILPDGGDDLKVQSGCNGIWMTKLTARGKNAHGSRPWEGDNAIKRLIDCLAEIQEVFGEADMTKSTLTISKIEGGTAINQVPAEAAACLDMRFVNSDERQRIQAEVEALAKGSQITIETLEDHICLETDLEDPYVKKFMEITSKVTGEPAETTRSFGASDARYFANYEISTILTRPRGGNPHGTDEWVDQADLLRFYDIVKAYVAEVARIS